MTAPPKHEITVALLADPVDPYRNRIPQSEWNKPYRDRRKVHIDAASSMTLAEVMQEAVKELGVVPPSGWELSASMPVFRRIPFFKEEDEEAFAPRALPRLHWAQLVLVDARGQAVFGVSDQRAVTIADLLRAADAGVIDGDPLRPYLMIEPGWGDAPPPDWPTVITGLRIAWEVLNHAAVAGGAWAFAEMIRQRLRDRLEAGRRAAENHREWAQREVRPYQFIALIRTRKWTTQELAQLLGCSDEEAEAVLWVLGFSLDAKSESWSWEGDVEASLANAIQEQIAIASHRGGQDWEGELRKRVLQLLETGESPPVYSPPPEAEEDIPYEWQPTAGERVGALLDDLLGRWRRR